MGTASLSRLWETLEVGLRPTRQTALGNAGAGLGGPDPQQGLPQAQAGGATTPMANPNSIRQSATSMQDEPLPHLPSLQSVWGDLNAVCVFFRPFYICNYPWEMSQMLKKLELTQNSP